MESVALTILQLAGAALVGLLAGRYGAKHIAQKAVEDRRLHVHQRQYDLEVDAYRKIWKMIHPILDKVADIRFQDQSKDTWDEERQQTLVDIGSAIQSLDFKIHRYTPFCDASVVKKLKDLSLNALCEATYPNHYQKDISDLIDSISNAIRDRVRQMNTEISSASPAGSRLAVLFPWSYRFWKSLAKTR